ncbi:DUF1294 domain-containing protein [Brevibacillus sp. B_LB10_24]|uniref:DUF1294 domain-containing protein n=1 Tax=Brevibacillus sp. B_LB10_24 TaxID=3380645 RepID=UPI0038BB28EB
MGEKLRAHARTRTIVLVLGWLLILWGVATGQHLPLFCGLLGINGYAFALMAIDKQAARRRQFRLPENSLLLTGLLGGAAGIGLGMVLVHHKSRHASFLTCIPLFFLLQAIGIWYLW